MKHSATDCQIVLINTARALKYLEDFGEWQSQLFTVLEKYHLLPDNLENLQLQFAFLKKATSKNIKHLQQAISAQQNCTATICTYINNILPHIIKLEQTVLELQKHITMDHDRVQLNTPDYDLDIDGAQLPRRHTNTAVVLVQDHFTPLDSETLDVTESQAEDHSTEEPSDPMLSHSEVSHGYEDLPSGIQDTTTTTYGDTTSHNAHADEIPELEDWNNGQFNEAKSTLIKHHNTHSESKCIRKEYTQKLLDLMDNQYYKKETLAYELQYSSPDSDYYNFLLRRSQKPPCDPNGYYSLPWTQQTCSTGMHGVEGGEPYYTAIDCMERKPDQWKVEGPERDGKITNRGYKN